MELEAAIQQRGGNQGEGSQDLGMSGHPAQENDHDGQMNNTNNESA
jgi:hypothetical protein